MRVAQGQFNVKFAWGESSAFGVRTWIFAPPLKTNGPGPGIVHVCGATLCIPGTRNVSVCTGPVTASL